LFHADGIVLQEIQHINDESDPRGVDIMAMRVLESGLGLSDAVEPLVGVHHVYEIIATCRVDPERILRRPMSFLVISQTGVDKPQIQSRVFIARISLRK